MTGEKDPVLSPWHKSSASGHTHCVEVQFGQATVRVRNSRCPDRTMEFTADEWKAFIVGARAGEFEWRPSFTVS